MLQPIIVDLCVKLRIANDEVVVYFPVLTGYVWMRVLTRHVALIHKARCWLCIEGFHYCCTLCGLGKFLSNAVISNSGCGKDTAPLRTSTED